MIDISSGDLVFYLDGVHSPETMEACGRWFSDASNETENVLMPSSSNEIGHMDKIIGKGVFNIQRGRSPIKHQRRFFYSTAWMQEIHTSLFRGLLIHVLPQGLVMTIQPSENLGKDSYWKSAVIPSLPLSINWLRGCVKENPSLRIQVRITGSLHLVGCVLKLLRRSTWLLQFGVVVDISTIFLIVGFMYSFIEAAK